MLITRNKIDDILSVVPDRAAACYTGQSILAYCDDPTFSWEEVNAWPDQTDVDIFAYTHSCHSAIVQAFMSAGWKPSGDIEEFKADRIRFWNPNKKFNLQTVGLSKPGYPEVNISWANGVEDSLDCIKRFDMDYLMVAMDLRTKEFADLRPKNQRVAHVNRHHHRFDPINVEPSYWYRQFERCPKGYSRGIDTRPVARQYAEWIKYTLSQGDKAAGSKSRQYANREKEQALAPLIAAGIPEDQAAAIYHMCRGEQNTWEAQALKHQSILDTIEAWLASVEDEPSTST